MTIDQGLKAALEPFAQFAADNVDEDGWIASTQRERIVDWFGPSDFRRLYEAYTALSTPSPSLPSREAIARIIQVRCHLTTGEEYEMSREAADAILSLLPVNGPREITVEKDAIARVLGAVLPVDIDWQHIRAASQAFVDKLAALSLPVNGGEADNLSERLRLAHLDGWEQAREAAAKAARDKIEGMGRAAHFANVFGPLKEAYFAAAIEADRAIRALPAAPGEGAGG